MGDARMEPTAIDVVNLTVKEFGKADILINNAGIDILKRFAQWGLSQAIDKELAHKGIKTCVVCPSATKTEFEVDFGKTTEGVANSN